VGAKNKDEAWYAEFLLEMDLKILLRKIGARLIFKIALISLHIDPALICYFMEKDLSTSE
jgi:hypothetical protein